MPHRSIPSLNWLRVFETAARCESFARAAEHLNMSPPAVSQQIKALEGHLGKPLFVRSAHRVELNDDGRAFLPVVQQALSSVETTAAALFGRPHTNLVSIRVITLLAVSWLPGLLPALNARYPKLRLQVNCGNIAQDFRSRTDDLHIAFGSPAEFPNNAVRLFGEQLFPVACPQVAHAITSSGDLLNHRLIEVAEHRSGWFQVLQETAGAHPGDADMIFADTTVVALAMAAAGCGVALARAPASDRLVQLHGLVACLDGIRVSGLQHYYLYAPGGQSLKRPARDVHDWLAAQCCNQPEARSS